MRVRVNREQIHIRGKHKFVRDDEVLLARRDVELTIVFQLEQHWKERRVLIGKVQPKTWLDRLRLAGRLQVDVQNQIRVFIEAQGHAFRLRFEHRARLPEKEVAVRIKVLGFDFEFHSREPGAGF